MMMRARWFAMMAASASLFALSCGPTALQLQARVADSVARTANAALPSVTAQYRGEALAAVEAAADKAGAQAAFEAVEERWEPVWAAWDAFAAAEGAWATAIESGKVTPAVIEEVIAGYCELRSAYPQLDVPALAAATCEPKEATK